MFGANFVDAQHQAGLTSTFDPGRKLATIVISKFVPGSTASTAADPRPPLAEAPKPSRIGTCRRAIARLPLSAACGQGPSGSMPRSILASAPGAYGSFPSHIMPPTRMATIGISKPPRPKNRSRTSCIHASANQRLSIYQPTTGFLVELTGIEPVASWLQTRRSPS